MINRSQIITQKIVAKSTGNILKFAQSSAADARQEAASAAMYKKKALEFIKDGRLDRIGVASVYFNSLDPTEKMQVINYWKEQMTTGSQKEQAASSFVGGPVDQSWYEANGIIPLSQKGAFQSRIKYLDQLASDIKSDMQAASGSQGAGAAASIAGAAAGAGSPKAQGPKQDMTSPYDPNVPLGAGPEGQKPTPSPTPSPTPGGSPDTGSDAAASKSKPDTGGATAATGGSANVSTAPATAQNTPIPSTPAPASPAASKIYFFPSNKPVGVEGFHGPYVSPEGKKRYFKVRYDKDVKRFMFTGEYEDK
jgi:hypothetical protein